MALPDDVDPRMLDGEVRAELRSLSKDTADAVAKHIVMTARLLVDQPEQALSHARAARALAGRVGAVREGCGLAAYAAGEWTEALAELRAARRITGQPVHLAVMADSERALDRPERALAYGDDADVPRLGQAERVELVIVLAGARRDLGQAEAAVLHLQDPARRTAPGRPWAPRLWYAYADALLAAGREPEAHEWFGRAADVDQNGVTDADERLLELDGVIFEDLDDGDDEPKEFSASEADAILRSLASRRETPQTAGPETCGPVEPPEAKPTPEDPAAAAPDRVERPPVELPEVEPTSSTEPGGLDSSPGVPAAPFSGTVADSASSAGPAAGDRVPSVSFTPAPSAPPDDDGEMRLFD